MDIVLIALVIFMLGIILGTAVALVISYANRLRIYLAKRSEEKNNLQAHNEMLKTKVEELEKVVQELLENQNTESINYSDAFEYTQAVLDGKEDLS